MSYNYDEFKELFNSIKALQKEHEKFIRKFLIEMGKRAMTMAIQRSPVDTGELRRNWFISDTFRRGTDELYVVLSNRKAYSGYIENGHRLVKGTRYQRADGQWVTVKENGWFEGYFMAKLSIEQIQREMPVRYERAFQQFCAGLELDT